MSLCDCKTKIERKRERREERERKRERREERERERKRCLLISFLFNASFISCTSFFHISKKGKMCASVPLCSKVVISMTPKTLNEKKR